ncbi:MAG TPA: hypothetical protein VK135_04225 [Candidatus Dormibacteraeota bacterium]|nr:hypothetical protein [Candidatus Dormibacteraeota bacterium]
MSNQRIQIIIQEINYWKEHKILPDMYCDFLLALYTKGESGTEASTKGKGDTTGLFSILQLTIQFFILLSVVVVINMQHMSHSFQFIFLFLSFLGMLWLFKLLSKNRDIYFHLSLTILLVDFFLVTVFLGNQYIHSEWGSSIIVIFNFICWLFIGYKYKLKYLQIITIFLLIFTTFYMFLS